MNHQFYDKYQLSTFYNTEYITKDLSINETNNKLLEEVFFIACFFDHL